ncbi:hypothetical protein KSF_063490 [Reticulibacter mediterranei]|uniref:pPIWI-RE three-gene island domain-containing protein n=1 Tax=Reticulibacter mediterranei TaxID=2778369 RepID=A0A8J3IU86_9CHLR|nr:hypothetical protein [Reticulibacter mediterranei]GHO96301.1 hypothetical protein KSF_063490 [Reticulibacter mediterranei]
MYDRSHWYMSLVQILKDQDQGNTLKGKYVLLLQVELGLRLLERLGLLDEPITVLWVILSGLPIPDSRLHAFDQVQRHMIANARILLPFSGRFNWEHALREYASLPQIWRSYNVRPDDFEKQMLLREPQFSEERLLAYDTVLDSILPFVQRTIKPATAAPFLFDAITRQGKQVVQVDIPEEIAERAATSIPWFIQPRPRSALSYSYDDLHAIAAEIDLLRQQRGLQSALGSQTSWADLVEKLIGYRAMQSDGSLSHKNAVPLELDGHAYVVGAVGAGKSTIAKLLLADTALHPEKDLRITIVVGDTMSALNLADDFNSFFCQRGENPVAAPLIGRSTRDIHLQRLYRSSKFRSDHWALRWLNTACPLQALATDQQNPVKPGYEPCEALYKLPKREGQRKTYSSCPLFSVCPSKQLYRDMPSARIWITTPGALGAASLPAQIDQRKIHLTEIVYEQSDLVIFDEADTVQEWFDNLFAGEVPLTKTDGSGLLDVEDVETAQAWIPRRTQPAPTRRWVVAERHSLASISNILSNLTDTEQGELLRHWIGRNFFTSLTLAYKLVWRLLDLPERDSDEYQQLDQVEANKKVSRIVRYFDRLSQSDPLTLQRPKGDVQRNQVYRLALIMRTLIAAGDSAHNDAVSDECKAWIQDFIPNIEQTLAKLAQRRVAWQAQAKQQKPHEQKPPDDLNTFALRLEFVLSVMILDRNIPVVFYEWYNKPENMITDLNEHSLERSPSNLADILPVPPTGRMFGTYYSKDLEIGQEEQRNSSVPSGLSVFGYPNVGRWYTMYFHTLFTDLDGRRGPNVLALSGTSWLPHSSRWHIDITPQGILDPSPEAQQAIEQSKFFYSPQYIRKKNGLEPIRISGKTEKLVPIKNMLRAIAGNQSNQRVSLKSELEWLRELGQQEPQNWQDRERLLLIVNSYDQARWAFQELRQNEQWQTAPPGEIRYLDRTDAGIDEVRTDDTIYRSDIEDFAQTNGKILIAPLQAIGRGYNILNRNGKAAFGAIYFLTRPMPYPADTQSLARELNRRTLDWCKDAQFKAWQEQELIGKALLLRSEASDYWRKAELRSYYSRLKHKDENNDTTYSERFDLAATTAGHIIQACGRLLRGGVPFHAYFMDAAWGPKSAEDRTRTETSDTSLLTAMIEVLQEYIEKEIGQALYEAIVNALVDIQGFNPEY